MIVRGQDYYKRDTLLGTLIDISRDNSSKGDVSVACGMATYDKDRDHYVANVFERADQAMYENKTSFKGE